MRIQKLIIWLLLLMLMLAACNGEKTDEKPTLTPSVTPSLTPQASDGVQARITAEQAPVFADANSTSTILTTLFKGDMRNVEAKSAPDVVGVIFYRLDLGNQTGWIAETQIELLGDKTVLGIDEATAVVMVTTVAPTFTDVATTEPTPSSPLAQVNVTRAVILSAPNRSAEELATAFEGERLAVLGMTTPDSLGDVYYQVELGTQIGWMLKSQVQILGDASLIAVVESETGTVTSADITPTQFVSRTPVPSLTPTRTLSPDETQLPQPEPTITPTVSNAIQEWSTPPLTIEVPQDWEAIHVLVPVASRFMAGNVGMSVYEGDLGNGLKGTIWIVWGFPNIGTMFGEVNLWADGLQILRGLMFAECNIGIDTQREYTIDDYTGVGTIFSAVDCPEGEDIAGWFTALQVQGGNYAFFMGIQPVERVTEGLAPLQAIIDTVQFEDIAE